MTKLAFVFLAPLANEYPAKQDVECVARIREPDAEQFSWHYGQNILRNITCEQDVECVARIRELAVYACMRAVLELYDPLPI